MFSHLVVGSNDIARSKKFYDALFVAMGGKPGVEGAKGRLIYALNGGRFMMSKPIDGKPATHANGGTIGPSRAVLARERTWLGPIWPRASSEIAVDYGDWRTRDGSSATGSCRTPTTIRFRLPRPRLDGPPAGRGLAALPGRTRQLKQPGSRARQGP